jgi:hypothetical protein
MKDRNGTSERSARVDIEEWGQVQLADDSHNPWPNYWAQVRCKSKAAPEDKNESVQRQQADGEAGERRRAEE